ncbi:hypothetical protein [Staphylococcus equorum]|uniref:hypothetical protein n=1 Tax=Staphylococcus equorum TaxID=246432 RepID=UPI002981B7CA|nr:hypothetical protein [Staphylococcus equorum]MDW5471991.1 hypothetical protein [Staphylococcus equorum]
MINTVKDYDALSKQYDKILAERNTLINDIAVLRANNKRLERENEQQTEIISLLNKESERHKEWEFEWHKKYNTLTNHIRMKAEANPGVSRYIALLNFIDKSEE